MKTDIKKFFPCATGEISQKLIINHAVKYLIYFIFTWTRYGWNVNQK